MSIVSFTFLFYINTLYLTLSPIRIFVFLMVLLSVAWIPLIIGYHEGQLYIYIQAVTGYIAPPICSIFLLAVFVPRINETVKMAIIIKIATKERSE